MSYFKVVEGKRVFISPMRIEDTLQYSEWMNDFEVRKYVRPGFITLAGERKWIEDVVISNEPQFAIVLKDKEKLIGNAGLHAVDMINRSAEFGIFIGDKSEWNKGYGTEATALVLDYAFNMLNLNNVMLKVYGFNDRAKRSYEKAGFKVIGSRREAKILGGKKYDEIFMDILAEEFTSPFIEKMMTEE